LANIIELRLEILSTPNSLAWTHTQRTSWDWVEKKIQTRSMLP